MARRIAIPSKAVELKLVGARDTLTIPRIQRLSVTADRPSTDIDELGNRLHSGTVEDVPAITVTFQAMDVGIKLFSILTGTDATAYPASGVSITALKDTDVIVNIKSDSVEDYVKASHARRCTIRDFTFTYNVDGESTEEYTIIGTQKRWFKNDVVVDKFVAGTTSFTLTQTPIALKGGNKALSVILDGVYLTEKLTAGPGTGEYYITGTTLTTGDSRVSQCIAVYQAAPAGNNWTDSTDATMPAAIRGMDVPVLINYGIIDRVQSVTINGTFNPQAVKEQGNRDLVGYLSQVPSVTGTITILDTDVDLFALLTTGQLNPSGVTEFGVSEFTATGLPMVIKLYDPQVKVKPYPAVKTLYMPAISITNEGFTSNVNQNAQQTYDFKSTTGEILVYKGSGIFG